MAKGDTVSMMMRGTMPGLQPIHSLKGMQAPAANAMTEDGTSSAVNPSQAFMQRYIDPKEKARMQEEWNATKGASNEVNGIDNSAGAAHFGMKVNQNEPQNLNASPMFTPSIGSGLAAPRLMPMQSGSKFARGKNPIGTNPQKMMKYGSGSY